MPDTTTSTVVTVTEHYLDHDLRERTSMSLLDPGTPLELEPTLCQEGWRFILKAGDERIGKLPKMLMVDDPERYVVTVEDPAAGTVRMSR